MMKKTNRAAALAVALAMLTASLPASAADADTGVRINEICTQNRASLLDSYGKASDWIELYHAGSGAADLSGWTLSDSKTVFTFPQGYSLAAGSCTVIFASKQNSADNELHTGFALSKNGETLTLKDAAGRVVQEIAVPPLSEDDTFGMVPDTGEWAVMQPSPGKANFKAVSAPEFSMTSGFYDASQTHRLTLSASADIYYTTDGSDPSASETAVRYQEPITLHDRSSEPNQLAAMQYEDNSTQSIMLKTKYRAPGYPVEKANVIRAAAKSGDSWSRTVTQTYFVLPSERCAFYQNFKVISLVTPPENLNDPERGIYVCGQQYLDWKANKFPDDPYDPRRSEYDSINKANFFSNGREWERPVEFTLFTGNTPAVSQKLGLRIKGASTCVAAQKGFNLYARGEYGDTKLNFKLIADNDAADNGKAIKTYDSFSLRPINYCDKMRDLTVQTPLSDLPEMATLDQERCVVFLDGEYWGTYDLSEKFSEFYYQSNYGIPAEQIVYFKDDEVKAGTQDDYDAYDALLGFITENDMSDPAQYRRVTEQLDVLSLIDHYAVCLYTGMVDWPDHNFTVWRYSGDPIDGNPYSDGRWRFGTFDFDYTSGLSYEMNAFNGGQGYDYDSFNRLKKSFMQPVLDSLMKNDSFRELFVTRYCDFANIVYRPERMQKLIAEMQEKYLDCMTESRVRWSSSGRSDSETLASQYRSTWQREIGVFETFFEKRPAPALRYMMQYANITADMCTVTLHTSGSGSLLVNGLPVQDEGSGITCQYPAGTTVTVTAVPDDGAGFAGWSGASAETEKTVSITLSGDVSLTAAFQEGVRGDINADGKCDAADAVLLRNWLLAKTDAQIADRKAADLNADGQLSATDLTLLKRILLK
ncbi:MAG: CotH kinase family protein [Oscillospiraceae bacterium]|nr:CotH kinase family protein [Oscillospiraceae bacterium]